MELEFYGLKTQPFGMAPDQRFFFASEHHRRGLAYLKYGLQQGEGFIVITGAVGTGKSILAARFLNEVESAGVTVARVATTRLDPEDALRFIMSGFGLVARGDKAGLLRRFEAFLRDESRAGRQIILIIDEAQALVPSTLEELRMLSNLSEDGSASLQCFLFGQPQLMTLLARPELEQVRQRIMASTRVGGLSETETRAYIEHRLTVAGWTGDPAFSDEVYHRLYDESGGIPRRINTLCNRLLLYGAIEELHRLEESHLDAALDDLRREAVDPVAAEVPSAGQLPARQTAVANALRPLEALLGEHDALLRRALALIEARQDALNARIGDAEAIPFPLDAEAAPDLADQPRAYRLLRSDGRRVPRGASPEAAPDVEPPAFARGSAGAARPVRAGSQSRSDGR